MLRLTLDVEFLVTGPVRVQIESEIWPTEEEVKEQFYAATTWCEGPLVTSWDEIRRRIQATC